MIDIVVVYDRSAASVIEQIAFVDSPRPAFEKRLERELAYRGRTDVEVVLLNAKSIEDLKVSHSRYFDPQGISAGRLQALSEGVTKRIAS